MNGSMACVAGAGFRAKDEISMTRVPLARPVELAINK